MSEDKKITYKHLEEKIKKQLDYVIRNGFNDSFINAKNLSATLVSLVKAGNERMSRIKE